MALVHSFEKTGNFLFKYRGHFPLALFIIAIPVLYFTDYSFLNETWYYILTGFAILVAVTGFLFRAIAIGTAQKNTSGRNRDKQIADALNTTGIYSTCRHPLYVGNYLMWIGIVIYAFNIWFVVLTSLLFWIYYERIMFAEERFLERKFGEDYVNWSMKVPAFFPSFKNYKKNTVPFSLKTILRREYSGVTATILSFLFIDLFRDAFILGRFEYQWKYGITAAVAILISLVLRSLKHYTKVLHEEDRS